MKTDSTIETAREAQARNEVGETEISRVLAWCMMFVFVATLFFVPLYQNEFEREGRIVGQSLRVDRLVGSTGIRADSLSLRERAAVLVERMEDYEDGLERESLLSSWVMPGMNRLLSYTRADLNEQVYLGRNGWFFYRPDIEHVTGPGFLDAGTQKLRAVQEGVSPDPVEAIVEFRNRLAERDIELLLVPVPTKAMVYPEEFSDQYSSGHDGVRNRSLEAFMRVLSGEGVHVVDVLPDLIRAKGELEAPLFLNSDTHWSPDGMIVTAGRAAQYIREHELIDDVGGLEFRIKELRPVFGDGDLEGMIGQRGDEQLVADLRIRKRVPLPTMIKPRLLYGDTGLFWAEDSASEILLLGDSFSRIFSEPDAGWHGGIGFMEQLSLDLAMPMEGIRINDNGAFATRQALSRDIQGGEDRLAGKRLVIWEFSMRELSFGDWRRGFEYAPQVAFSGVNDAGGISAKGIIERITRPPGRDETAYPNGLISIHLRDVVSLDPTVSLPGEVVVFAWGQRNYRLTDAAGYVRGQELSLNLTRWADARDVLGDFSRSEFQDIDLLTLFPFFGEGIRGGIRHAVDPIPSDFEYSDSAANLLVERDLKERINESATDVEQDFMEVVLARLEDSVEGYDVAGRDGWFVPESFLYRMLAGTFWASPDWDFYDELVEYSLVDGIVNYHDALKERGIELIVLPVPGLLFVYPDEVLGTERFNFHDDSVRLDRKYYEVYEMLRERGVDVLDLYPDLRQSARAHEELLYRKDDHHWSGHGVREAAKFIYEKIGDTDGFESIPRRKYRIEPRYVVGRGSHWDLTERGDPLVMNRWPPLDYPELEVLSVQEVLEDGSEAGVELWRESPVLLLGDSFVANLTDEHMDFGAGLPDHLATYLGFPVDLVSVNGGGRNGARLELALDEGRLDNKRVVIWCFYQFEMMSVKAVDDAWRRIPLPKSAKE